MAAPRIPNLLITGTPGTGKTTLAAEVAQVTGWQHINIGDLVKEQELHEGWDDEYECWILDEDKVLDALEERMVQGGCIIDHHTCDFFPERGYTDKKVTENMQCEIMMVVQEEAKESYSENVVQVLGSNTVDDMEANALKISAWISQQGSQ